VTSNSALSLRTATFFAILIACIAGNALAVKVGPMRKQAVDMVVLHSTGGPTCDATTGRPVWVKAGTLRDNIRNIEAHAKLGIHYMIDRDGTVQASVPEDQVAHHVFKYSARSIGIELINDGDGRDPFPEPQLDALVKLLRDITQRRGIGPAGIKRHSDLDHSMLPCDRSQRRKVDPGAAFPYQVVLDRVFQPN
jgi:N-acetylmuramoyl-L-alanine amidase